MTISELHLEARIPAYISVQLDALKQNFREILKGNDITAQVTDFPTTEVTIVSYTSSTDFTAIILDHEVIIDSHRDYNIQLTNIDRRHNEIGFHMKVSDDLLSNIDSSFHFNNQKAYNQFLPLIQIEPITTSIVNIFQAIFKDFILEYGIIHHDISCIASFKGLPSPIYRLIAREASCRFKPLNFYSMEEIRLLREKDDVALPASRSVTHGPQVNTATTRITQDFTVPPPTYQPREPSEGGSESHEEETQSKGDDKDEDVNGDGTT